MQSESCCIAQVKFWLRGPTYKVSLPCMQVGAFLRLMLEFCIHGPPILAAANLHGQRSVVLDQVHMSRTPLQQALAASWLASAQCALATTSVLGDPLVLLFAIVMHLLTSAQPCALQQLLMSKLAQSGA